MGNDQVTKRFSVALDIKRSVSNREFEVVEDDNGNILHISLTDDGEPVDLSGCRILAIFSKSTGTSSQDSAREDGGITVGGEENNEITIRLFTASFSPGMVECEVQIYSGSELRMLATSAKFNFNCRRGILNGDTVKSTEEYPLLIDLIHRVEIAENTLTTLNEETTEAIESANGAAENANEAARYAHSSGDYAKLSADEADAAAENANRAAESADTSGQSASLAAERANTAAKNVEDIVVGALPKHASLHAKDGEDPISAVDIAALPVFDKSGSYESINDWMETGIYLHDDDSSVIDVPNGFGSPIAVFVATVRDEVMQILLENDLNQLYYRFGTGRAYWNRVAIEDELTPRSMSQTVTLRAAGWSNKQQSVIVFGVSEFTNVYFNIAASATDAQYDAGVNAKLTRAGQGRGSLTIKARGDVPTVDVPIEVVVLG